MSSRKELEQMSRAARFYYADEMTQQEVAQALGVSRPTVSRLLAQARCEGIVQITIVDPFTTVGDLEARLVKTFDLKRAVVVAGEGLNNDLLHRRLGFAAAGYLQQTLGNGDRVGIGWGRTLHAVVEALDSTQRAAIQVYPLIGGMGQISPSFQVNNLAQRLAEMFNGSWHPFFAPAFVSDPAALNGLLRLPDLEMIHQSWLQLDIALIGIGHFALQRQSSMLFASYMADDALQKLEQCGAAGDLCGRFFDLMGHGCFAEPGVIGISLEQLALLDNVVGVAGGVEKTSAILGALRGRYLNVLITDSIIAGAVLEENGKDNWTGE